MRPSFDALAEEILQSNPELKEAIRQTILSAKPEDSRCRIIGNVAEPASGSFLSIESAGNRSISVPANATVTDESLKRLGRTLQGE